MSRHLSLLASIDGCCLDSFMQEKMQRLDPFPLFISVEQIVIFLASSEVIG